MEPMTMMLLGSGIQSGMSLGKSLMGAVQLATAKKPSDIKYEIPSGFMEYLSRADMLARQGLPGEDVIRGQIGSQVSGAVSDVSRAADSSVGALGAMQNIYGKGLDAVMDLNIKSAEFRRRAQEAAMGAQKEHGMYQDKAWEYNVNIPYQRRMHEYQSQRQAGMQNMWSGLDGLGAGAVTGMSGMSEMSQMEQMIEAVKGLGVGGGQAASPAFRGYTPPVSEYQFGGIFNPPQRNIFQ